MSRSSRNGSGFYRFEMTSACAASVHTATAAAVAAGRGAEFLSVLRLVIRDIQMDPGLAGDPVYSLKGSGLLVYSVARRPVSLHYMADPHRHMIWPMFVRAMV